MRAQAVLASTLSGYLVPFRAVDDPIDPTELPPDTRRQLRLTRRLANPGTWPIIERAFDYLKEQEAIDPQAIANLIKTSTLTARAIGLPANAALTQRINAELRESIARGEGAREWSARLRAIIGTRSSYEETISRTATHRAYLDGQRKVAAGPAGDRFPYRTYAATRDTRTRQTHKDMDGKVYHKDSPMAAKAKTLLDEFNCRCNESILTRKQALERGIDDDTGWVEPTVEEAAAVDARKQNIEELKTLMVERFFADAYKQALEKEQRAKWTDSIAYHEKLGLTADEYAAVDAYSGPVFKGLNKSLRTEGKQGTKTEAAKAYEKRINAALAKLPKQEVTLVRGFTSQDTEALRAAPVGAVIHDKGFVSLSTSEVAASGFGKHRLVIRNAKAANISDVIGGNEQEYLLPTNTRLRIVDKQTRIEDGEEIVTIYAEIVE